ncbi:hypothetical protein GQ53DRAFT_840678 [Thozetella sp. PMI_491]|nr:hypothetical protein GQ53DRAFT_840678 [Thozetella sp. PMI_491]
MPPSEKQHDSLHADDATHAGSGEDEKKSHHSAGKEAATNSTAPRQSWPWFRRRPDDDKDDRDWVIVQPEDGERPKSPPRADISSSGNFSVSLGWGDYKHTLLEVNWHRHGCQHHEHDCEHSNLASVEGVQADEAESNRQGKQQQEKPPEEEGSQEGGTYTQTR